MFVEIKGYLFNTDNIIRIDTYKDSHYNRAIDDFSYTVKLRVYTVNPKVDLTTVTHCIDSEDATTKLEEQRQELLKILNKKEEPQCQTL